MNNVKYDHFNETYRNRVVRIIELRQTTDTVTKS